MSDKKYISPEHAIRNILELKSIGHNVQTANAFFKPIGVISPPKGEEHVDGNADKIRAARSVAEERQSVTMREENIEENKLLVKGVELLVKKGTDVADDVKKFTDDFWSKIKPAEEVPNLPAKTTEKLPAKSKDNLPSVQQKLKEPEVEIIPPGTKPEAGVKAKNITPDKTRTEVKPQTQTQTQTRTEVKPQTQTQTQTRTRTEISKPPRGGNRPPAGRKPQFDRLPFGLPGFTPGQSVVVSGAAPPFGVQHYRHMADPRRAGFDEESRYEIEAVPRPNSKDKKNRTRQAEIIRKVIEEQKAKKKKDTTVIVNPKLNNPDPGSN